MKREPTHLHFEEKTALEHLKEARRKGQTASESVHGAEPSGQLIAATDSAKETAIYLFIAFLLLSPFSFDLKQKTLLFSCFTLALILWKTCRSALFGWARLQRVHRLITQEKWEIEHHRAQEKEELLELYKAKGFKNKQLEEVVEVLMADDNRLLQIMLEEELGLTLGSFEHPLKQCIGAAIGVIIAAPLSILGLFALNFSGLIIATLLTFSVSSILAAKHLNNNLTRQLIWDIASATLTLGVLYFLIKTFSNYLPQA